MQDDFKDCGAASLLTIIKTYGGNVSLEYLKMLTNTTKNGTNAYYLMEAAKSVGFDTRAVKGNITELREEFLPCIAHVIIDSKYKHFVVVHKISKKHITIADPSSGIKNMSYEEFNEISTNYFLLFIPNKKMPCFKNKNDFLKILLKKFLEYKSIVVSIFVFSLIFNSSLLSFRLSTDTMHL